MISAYRPAARGQDGFELTWPKPSLLYRLFPPLVKGFAFPGNSLLRRGRKDSLPDAIGGAGTLVMRAAVRRFTSSLAHDAVTVGKLQGLGLLLVCPHVHLPAFPKEAGPKFREKGETFSGVFASISVQRKEALRIGWILSPYAGTTRLGLSFFT